MRVHLAFRPGKFREPILEKAVKHGMEVMGWEPAEERKADISIFWGIPDCHWPLIHRLREAGKPFLLVDFAFWGRTNRDNIKAGYYKVSLNGINPHGYLEAGGTIPGRYEKTGGPSILPWNKRGKYILLAGMGPKSCNMFGIGKNEWDIDAARIIMENTSRPVVFRQKPSDKTPQKIEGTIFDDGRKPIHQLIDSAFAVVTHHGNTTVEALARGVPVFTKESITLTMGHSDLSLIETPLYPKDRELFLERLAVWQWRWDEIALGKCFKHLVKQGLI